MTPTTKGGAAIGGIAVVVAGGYGVKALMAEGDSYESGEKWPEFLFPLDDAIDTAYRSGNFGYENGRYFVDPKEDNKWWWDKVFEDITESDPTIQNLFSNSENGNGTKKIEKGFGTEETALSKICDDIYKTVNTNIDTTGGTGKYKEEAVWKYCSPLGSKPQTIDVANETDQYSDTNSLGKTKKDKLIAIKDTSKFWDFQEARFRGREIGNFEGTESPFKKARENKNTKQIVKELCKELYEKTSTDIESYKKDFWQFCSFKGVEN